MADYAWNESVPSWWVWTRQHGAVRFDVCGACLAWLGLSPDGSPGHEGSCALCRDGALRIPPSTPQRETLRMQAFLQIVGPATPPDETPDADREKEPT